MQGGCLELVVAVVEDDGWVQTSAAKRHFEMEMLSGGSARATGKSDHLTCLHLVALLHEVLALMTVERLQSIGMLDADLHPNGDACRRRD